MSKQILEMEARNAALKCQESETVMSQRWSKLIVDDDFRFTFHEVWIYPDALGVYTPTEFQGAIPAQRLHASPPLNARNEQPIAGFQLVVVHRSSPQEIVALLEACGIDLVSCLPIFKTVWHSFDRFVNGDDDRQLIYCLCRRGSRLVWKYDKERQHTCAIAMDDPEEQTVGRIDFDRFKAHLVHPLALAYFEQSVIVDDRETEFQRIRNAIREIEAWTGHRNYASNSKKAPLSTNQLNLAEMSQVMSSLSLRLLSIKNWLGHYSSVLQESSMLDSEPQISCLSDVTVAAMRPIWEDWVVMNRIHSKRMNSLHDFADYLSKEIQIQNTVIFNLISQRDTNQSLVLARSSKLLAEAAGKDSSSMQTIAVMTMALLPGTFFAALFSMPLLRWEQDAVISDRFWIYIVFSLPTTALVFAIWLLSTKPWRESRYGEDTIELEKVSKEFSMGAAP